MKAKKVQRFIYAKPIELTPKITAMGWHDADRGIYCLYYRLFDHKRTDIVVDSLDAIYEYLGGATRLTACRQYVDEIDYVFCKEATTVYACPYKFYLRRRYL